MRTIMSTCIVDGGFTFSPCSIHRKPIYQPKSRRLRQDANLDHQGHDRNKQEEQVRNCVSLDGESIPASRARRGVHGGGPEGLPRAVH